MVDVSKLRDRVEGSLIALPWSADMLAALAELEQLRKDSAELARKLAIEHHDHEQCHEALAEAETEHQSLRAAARALRDKLPGCDFNGYDNKSPRCGKPATHSEANYGEPSYYCPEHARKRHSECAWAAALRALEEELGKP